MGKSFRDDNDVLNSGDDRIFKRRNKTVCYADDIEKTGETEKDVIKNQ